MTFLVLIGDCNLHFKTFQASLDKMVPEGMRPVVVTA